MVILEFSVHIFNLTQSTFKWYYTTSWIISYNFRVLFLLSEPSGYHCHAFYFYILHKSHNMLLLFLFSPLSSIEILMSQTFTFCYHFQCPWLLWRYIFLPAAIFPFASRTFFSVIQIWWVDSFSFWTSEDVFILFVFRRCLGRQFRKVLPQQWEMRYFCWVLNSRLKGVFFPLSTLKILSSICSTPGVHQLH